MKKLALVAVLLSSLSVLPAHADSQTANFTVSATVVNSCTISATDINFGQLSIPSAGKADAEGTVSVACTVNLPYSVTVTAADGSTGTPKMKNASGSSTIAYGLYTDAARSTKLADGSNGGAPFTGVGNGLVKQHTVYARLDLNQPAEAGAHSNTHVATIVY